MSISNNRCYKSSTAILGRLARSTKQPSAHARKRLYQPEPNSDTKQKHRATYSITDDNPTTTSNPSNITSPSTTSFRSDVNLSTALNLGKIGTSATTASTAAASSLSATNPRLNSSEYLDSLEEGVNKTVDSEIETLLSSYKELVSLATVSNRQYLNIVHRGINTDRIVWCWCG